MRRQIKLWYVLVTIMLVEVCVYILRVSRMPHCDKSHKKYSIDDVDVREDEFNPYYEMDYLIEPLNDDDDWETNTGDRNKEETMHIAFLKVHKAASTTVQTILFRYGYTRDLDFVLPVKGHYFSSNTSMHKTLVPPGHGIHYDILSIHCFFNYSIVSSVMPRNTKYIAIVREPLAQFASAVHYYRDMLKFPYLTQMTGNVLHELINNPTEHESSVLTYTMNSMARDFGFQQEHFFNYSRGSDDSSAHAYLYYLDTIFSCVMVAEYFDESLVLMKRLFNWSLKDILYISQNVHHTHTDLSTEDIATFKKRNKLDYLIYNHYRRRFLYKLRSAGQDLQDETNHFRKLLGFVQEWCENDDVGEYTLHRSRWNSQFKIDKTFCLLLKKNEMGYIDFLRRHQTSLKKH